MYSAVSRAKSEGDKSPYLRGAGGAVCSMGMEPIDGIGTLFSGWRQQSMLEKVGTRAVRSYLLSPL